MLNYRRNSEDLKKREKFRTRIRHPKRSRRGRKVKRLLAAWLPSSFNRAKKKTSKVYSSYPQKKEGKNEEEEKEKN